MNTETPQFLSDGIIPVNQMTFHSLGPVLEMQVSEYVILCLCTFQASTEYNMTGIVAQKIIQTFHSTAPNHLMVEKVYEK